MERFRELPPVPVRDRTFGRMLARKAAENGDRTYLIFEGRRYSYREVDAITTRVANALQARGIRKGDHVGILFDNRPELLWIYFALAKIGGVSVPINTAAKGELLSYFVNQSDAVAVILETAFVERYLAVQGDCKRVGWVAVLDEAGTTPLDPRFAVPAIDFHDLEKGDDTPIDADVKFNDPFGLFYTSGTTGPSKGNIFTHCNALTGPLARVEFFGYQRDDVLYVCLPLFHGNALFGGCIPGLVGDCVVALSRRFSASNFWKEVRAVGATKFNLLSAMVNILWTQPPSPDDNDGILRQTTMVPIPEFGLEFAKRFNLQLTSVYALSDYGNATVLPPGFPPEKFRSAGQPRPQMKVAILDDDDLEVAKGEVGEICLRANEPWISAQGYYNMPEATLKSYRNLWFHTGDRGYFDADGYLYFADRKKDAIRRRGENVSSWEVESIMAKHPAIEEVAVFAVRSEMSEDEVMAAIVRRPGAAEIDLPELVRFCQANMAYFMVPRFIEIVDELPKTMTQKVQKFRLQQSAQERLHEIWDREKAGIKVTR